MTVKWVEENEGVLGVPAPRDNVEIINGLQFVEPMTAGFIANRLANMSWLTDGVTTPPPFGIPGVIAFETAGDIQLSPGTPTALDMLMDQAAIAGQVSDSAARIPPGTLLAVEVAPAIGADPARPPDANFLYFTINTPDFKHTIQQLQQIVGSGSDFALLGADINSPPLSIPVPGGVSPQPPGPPAVPPLPTTPTEEAPKKKKSSKGLLIGAGTGALLGIIAGGLPGLVVGAAGGAILGKVATK